ncbi:MAG TPA: hypothetical protein VMA98_12005 [Candidatus Acidoferrales bacterium]|nr:hypothetical protein [Candidatus Acidoferrales bacterium]
MQIFSCQIFSGSPPLPLDDELGLAVRFKNDSPDELTSIVWRTFYGPVPVDFIDDGSFAPQAQIDNYLLYERGSSHLNVTSVLLDALSLALTHGHAASAASLVTTNLALPPHAGTEDPGNCTIVRATYASGALWTNPALPQSIDLMPTPSPRPTATAAPNTPLIVDDCTLILFGGKKALLQVRFRNQMRQPIEKITFRAQYEASGLDFTDRGRFLRDASITHTLELALPDALRSRMYRSFDDPNRCAPANIRYADGEQWQNPYLSATPGPLPTPIPNALSARDMRMRWTQRHGFPTPIPTSDDPSHP